MQKYKAKSVYLQTKPKFLIQMLLNWYNVAYKLIDEWHRTTSERDKTARILLLSPILRFDFVHNGSRPGITTGLYNRSLSEIERVYFVKESTMPGFRLNIRTNKNCLIFKRVCVKWEVWKANQRQISSLHLTSSSFVRRLHYFYKSLWRRCHVDVWDEVIPVEGRQKPELLRIHKSVNIYDFVYHLFVYACILIECVRIHSLYDPFHLFDSF